jgi:hypothetical protein
MLIVNTKLKSFREEERVSITDVPEQNLNFYEDRNYLMK